LFKLNSYKIYVLAHSRWSLKVLWMQDFDFAQFYQTCRIYNHLLSKLRLNFAQI